MTITEDLRTQLRALRIERGLTQQQLADRAGLSRDMVSRVERGDRLGSMGTIRKMTAALKVRIVMRLEGIEVDNLSSAPVG